MKPCFHQPCPHCRFVGHDEASGRDLYVNIDGAAVIFSARYGDGDADYDWTMYMYDEGRLGRYLLKDDPLGTAEKALQAALEVGLLTK